jgi:hypothetical protein
MNNDGSDSELSVNSLSRQAFRDQNRDESNETLDAIPMTNSSEQNEAFDDDQSSDVIIHTEKNIFVYSNFFFLDFNNENC